MHVIIATFDNEKDIPLRISYTPLVKMMYRNNSEDQGEKAFLLCCINLLMERLHWLSRIKVNWIGLWTYTQKVFGKSSKIFLKQIVLLQRLSV